MATRATIRADLRARLGEAAADVWTDADLNTHIANAITGLYPSFYQRKVNTTTAGTGPVQTKPTGAVNLFYVAVVGATSTRARTIRGWSEGDTDAIVPKLNITGQTLVWGWTEPFAGPTDDVTTLTIPKAAEEVVLLRAHVAALEQMLTTRDKKQRYFNLNVREAVTEQDVGLVLDALHTSIDNRLKYVLPLPQRIG